MIVNFNFFNVSVLFIPSWLKKNPLVFFLVGTVCMAFYALFACLFHEHSSFSLLVLQFNFGVIVPVKMVRRGNSRSTRRALRRQASGNIMSDFRPSSFSSLTLPLSSMLTTRSGITTWCECYQCTACEVVLFCCSRTVGQDDKRLCPLLCISC